MRAEPTAQEPASFARWTNLEWLFVAMLVATTLVLVRLGSTTYYSNDAAQYWSTINNLLQGNGIRTSAVYYEVQAVHGLPAQQTVWPPGMPLLAAGFAWLTAASAERAVAVLNAVAHGLTALLLFWLVSRLRGSRPAGVAFATGYLLFAPSLVLVISGLSEPFSILATVAAAACLAKAFEGGEEPSLAWLGAAAAAIGAGTWLRYQVIFQAAPLGLICLAVLWRKRGLVGATMVSGLVMLPAIAAFASLLFRNWVLTGTATGGNAAARGNTIGELAFQAKWAMLSYFGGGAAWLDRALILIFLAAGLAGVILAWRRGARWQIAPPSINAMVAAYALAGAILTALIIVILASRSTFYTLEGRYFQGAVLLAAIGLAAALPRGLWQPGDAAAAFSARVFALAAAGLVLVQLNGLRTFVRNGGDASGLRRALATTHEGQSIEDLLRSSASERSPVMSNQSQLLHVVLQRPTFSVPERRLTPRAWKGSEIIAEARRFGVSHIVVFRKMPLGSTDGSTDYVWQMGEQPPADLIRVHMSDDIALYRIATR